MSAVTENLKKYISDKGINLSKLASNTGYPYDAIQASLGNLSGRNRSLRDNEFLDICRYLEVDPFRFAEKKEESSENCD